jgi:cytochrome c oxidase subunit II
MNLATDATFWLPPAHSNLAGDSDHLFYFIYWLCVVFFVGICACMFWFMWRYQRRVPGQQADPTAPTHNTPIEIIWSGIPLLLAIYIFYLGFDGYVKMAVPPSNAYQIHVTGKKWSWNFAYDTGFNETGFVHVYPDKPIKFLITAEDVLHSVYIAEFRTKMDALPGRYTSLWFTVPRSVLPANEAEFPEHDLPGGKKSRWIEYHLTCTEYCGTSHSDMWAKVCVHPSRESFEQWQKDAIFEDPDPKAMEKMGETVYKQNCAVCHNIDGTQLQGPNWRDLIQALKTNGTRPTNAGDVQVDENYIAESIREPGAKLVTGFQNVMPTFKGQLNDYKIRCLITYMRSKAQ